MYKFVFSVKLVFGSALRGPETLNISASMSACKLSAVSTEGAEAITDISLLWDVDKLGSGRAQV